MPCRARRHAAAPMRCARHAARRSRLRASFLSQCGAAASGEIHLDSVGLYHASSGCRREVRMRCSVQGAQRLNHFHTRLHLLYASSRSRALYSYERTTKQPHIKPIGVI
jgi:hypothetical protein